MRDQEQQFQDDFETIDLRELFNTIFRWKWMILVLTLTATITAGVLSFFVLPPVYEASTSLLVMQGDTKKQVRPDSGDLESLVGSLSRLPEMTINTYVRQVTNPTILSNTIKALKLEELGYTTIGLEKMISVSNQKDTNLIDIKVENTDPALGQAIANELAKQTLGFISDNNQEQMSKSVMFLQQQADSVKKQLVDVTKKLDSLQSQARSVNLLEQEKTSKTEDLMNFRSQYMQAQIEYNQLMVGNSQLESKLSNMPQTIKTKDVNNPEVELEVANSDYVQLLALVENKRVALMEKEAQLEGLNKYIKTLEKELGTLQAEVTEKKAEETLLQKQIVELDNTYRLLSEKITQTQITQSINLGETNLQVVSKALMPIKPIKPKKALNIAIAGVLGIMISIGLAFVLEFLDNTIKTKEDVEKKLGLPVLGAIPQYKPEKFKKEVVGHGQGTVSSASHSS